MKAKISFFGGIVLGLLAGSRIGPELYRRASAAASSIASNPQVRKGATAAGDRAAHAAKSATASATHQVRHAGEVVAHQFTGRFGDRWNHVAHSAHAATNGSAHGAHGGVAGGFDDDPLGE